MIKDVQGKITQVGDKVAFAGGGKGASEFYVGEVLKITKKGVTIGVEKFGDYWVKSGAEFTLERGAYFDEWQRNEGMFAILGENK